MKINLKIIIIRIRITEKRNNSKIEIIQIQIIEIQTSLIKNKTDHQNIIMSRMILNYIHHGSPKNKWKIS